MIAVRQPLVRILRGLPGSGKTHWARARLAEHLADGGAWNTLVRLSRDDLRAMLAVGYAAPIREFEDQLTELRDAMLATLLHNGIDVIVDELNLDPQWWPPLVETIESLGARWEIVDFLEVPVATCIARDAARTGVARVGARVILDLHQRFVATGATILVPLA